MGAGLACRAGCAGSWAQREPFSLGKAIRCKAAGPKQGRQPRAQHGTEQPQKVVVEGKRWLGTAWGTQCTYPVRTVVPTSFAPRQPSPSFLVLILAWLFSGCDHLYLSP